MANQPPRPPPFRFPIFMRAAPPPPPPRPPSLNPAPGPLPTFRPPLVAPIQPNQPVSRPPPPPPVPPEPDYLSTPGAISSASPSKPMPLNPAPSSPIIRASPPLPPSPSPAPKSPSKTMVISPSPSKPKPQISVPSSPITNKSRSPASTSIVPYLDSASPSPTDKSLIPPPSPFKLPPPLFNAEETLESIPQESKPKTVLMQETTVSPKMVSKNSNGHQWNHQNEAPKNTTPQNGKPELRKDKGVQKKPSEELGISVLTLAGENKGAIMELNSGQGSSRDHNAENSMMKKNDIKSKHGIQTRRMQAYINNNVQGVNNSVLYGSSCTYNDPGIHLSLSGKGNPGNSIHHKENMGG